MSIAVIGTLRSGFFAALGGAIGAVTTSYLLSDNKMERIAGRIHWDHVKAGEGDGPEWDAVISARNGRFSFDMSTTRHKFVVAENQKSEVESVGTERVCRTETKGWRLPVTNITLSFFKKACGDNFQEATAGIRAQYPTVEFRNPKI